MPRALSMSMLAAIAASVAPRKPTEAEVADFRRRCSEADLLLLGHLAFEARDQVLRDIAEAEVSKRLGRPVASGKGVL